METMQKQHIAERDRLRAELAVTHAAEAAEADDSLDTETPNPRFRKRRVRRTQYGLRPVQTRKE
jgi:hypothetical protein